MLNTGCVYKKSIFQIGYCILFWLCGVTSSAWALSEAAEMDRLVQAVEKHLELEDYQQAESYMVKIEALSVKPPAHFYFFKGQVLQYLEQSTQAQVAYETYVGLVGDEGEYYWLALENITQIQEIEVEQMVNKNVGFIDSDTFQDAVVSQEELLKRKMYQDRLMKLYLTDSFEAALVQHINAILASSIYTGTRVNSNDSLKKAISYSISVSDKQEIVSLKRDKSVVPESISTQHVSPFGVSRTIDYECRYQRADCLVRLPGSIDTWFKIEYSEESAQALSKALSQLIRLLQKTPTEAPDSL